MAAILNSAMLNSDTAILDSDPCYLLSDSLKNTLTPIWLWIILIQSASNSFLLTKLDDGHQLEFCQLEFCHLGFNHFTQKNFTYSFWLNLMMAAIFNLAILKSAILVFPLKLTHTCQDWIPPFPKKQNFTASFLFTICTIYFPHSIWLTWWWQPSWILPSWIQPFWTKLWLKLIQSDSNSFILTQLDDGSHLKFSHLGFSHLSFSSQTHSHLPRLVPTISKKKNFTHSSLFTICKKYFTHSIWLTWWWQPSWVPPSWIQPS